MIHRPLLASSLLCLSLCLPSVAQARKNVKELTYSYDVVWSTAVRLIRADLGHRIKEKDKETGFILFAYPGRGKVKEFGGAMEILSFVNEEGYRKLKVQLDIGGQPSYIEIQILDKLERKLYVEQGTAPKAVQVRKKKKKGKGKGEQGTEKGTGEGKSKGKE